MNLAGRALTPRGCNESRGGSCANGATHPSLGPRPWFSREKYRGLKAAPGALPQAGMEAGLWPSHRTSGIPSKRAAACQGGGFRSRWRWRWRGGRLRPVCGRSPPALRLDLFQLTLNSNSSMAVVSSRARRIASSNWSLIRFCSATNSVTILSCSRLAIIGTRIFSSSS